MQHKADGYDPVSYTHLDVYKRQDLHNTEFGEGNTTLLQMLSECQPDIIVITGDLIDAQHTNIEVALEFPQVSYFCSEDPPPQ